MASQKSSLYFFPRFFQPWITRINISKSIDVYLVSHCAVYGYIYLPTYILYNDLFIGKFKLPMNFCIIQPSNQFP